MQTANSRTHTHAHIYVYTLEAYTHTHTHVHCYTLDVVCLYLFMLNIEVHMKPLRESGRERGREGERHFKAGPSISGQLMAAFFPKAATTTKTSLPQRTFTVKVDFLLRHFCGILRFFRLPFASLAFLFSPHPRSHLGSPTRYLHSPAAFVGFVSLSCSKQSGPRFCVHPQKCL